MLNTAKSFLYVMIFSCFECFSPNADLYTEDCCIYYDKGVHIIDFGSGEQEYIMKNDSDAAFLDTIFNFAIIANKGPIKMKRIDSNDDDPFIGKLNVCVQREWINSRNYYLINYGNGKPQTLGELESRHSFISINSQFFYLDSLYWLNTADQNTLYEPRLGWECNAFYEFNFNKKNYILFFVNPIVTNSRTVEYRGILLEIAEKNIKIIAFPHLQKESSPQCINDFNHDGNLDCVSFSNSDTIKLFTMNKDKFVPDLFHFIFVKYSIDDTYLIDRAKSKWFCKDSMLYHICIKK